MSSPVGSKSNYDDGSVSSSENSLKICSDDGSNSSSDENPDTIAVRGVSPDTSSDKNSADGSESNFDSCFDKSTDNIDVKGSDGIVLSCPHFDTNGDASDGNIDISHVYDKISSGDKRLSSKKLPLFTVYEFDKNNLNVITFYGKNQDTPAQLCGSGLSSCKDKHQRCAIISSKVTSGKDDGTTRLIPIVSACNNLTTCYHRRLEARSLDALY